MRGAGGWIPLLFFAAALFPSAAAAQGDLTRVFPNGARQGTTVTLAFGGDSLPDPATLLVEGGGIEPLGPFVKGQGKVRIAADAAAGVRQLRLVGPKAVTTPRPFAVGVLPELDEKEPNDRPEQAQRLEQLPVTLNGSLPTRPDIDQFVVPMKRGECLVVAGESRALGAPTNLLVRIRDAAGVEQVVQMDYRTRDPLLGFTAPADGDYRVELQEVMNNYSGINADYVYRVTLTKGPWIDTAFPPGARRGSSARLTFSGWNLGGKSGPSQLEAVVEIPADAGPRFRATAGGAANSVEIAVGSAPETLEADGAEPTEVPVPGTVSGRFQRGEADRFRFAARAGQPLVVAVEARALDSFADPLLLLEDASGKLLATADDAAGTRDPRLVWTPPADGSYTVVLRDIASGSRGGPGFFYRLTVAPPEPELRLTTPSPTLVLKPGEKLEIAVSVHQSFQPGEVTLEARELPAGVTADPVRVPASPGKSGTTQAKLILTAAKDAAPGSAVVRIVGAASGTAPLAAAAGGTWVLSKDRSGTLATGSTESLLLHVPAP